MNPGIVIQDLIQCIQNVLHGTDFNNNPVIQLFKIITEIRHRDGLSAPPDAQQNIQLIRHRELCKHFQNLLLLLTSADIFIGDTPKGNAEGILHDSLLLLLHLFTTFWQFYIFLQLLTRRWIDENSKEQ